VGELIIQLGREGSRGGLNRERWGEATEARAIARTRIIWEGDGGRLFIPPWSEGPFES